MVGGEFQTYVEQKPATAFKEYILKVHSRCNLACRYCYVYAPDNSWKRKSELMSDPTILATALRIGEHAATHNLQQLHLTFHGGEPLLADSIDPDFYPRAVRLFREALPRGTVMHFGIQTNGTLLSERNVRMFKELGIAVGVSLDGNRAANDKNRVHFDERGSYDEVVAGIRLLQQHPDIFTGLLCVINLDNDPLETYAELRSHNPPSIDLLLQLGNWSDLPPGHDPQQTRYADWLIPIFDTWFKDKGAPKIRLFDEIQRLLLGQPSSVEYLGLTPAPNIVIEPNGSIAGFASMAKFNDIGLNVFEHSFDDALCHPLIRERLMGIAALSQTCLKCRLVEVCGGGYYTDRYKKDETGESFRNPSVYCRDLKKLIGHIGLEVIKATRGRVKLA